MSIFGINKKKIVVEYIDLDDSSKQIASSGEISGSDGQIIDYSSQDQIKELEEKGYVLEKNGFDPDGKTPTFDDTTEYKITFKHKKVTVSAPDQKLGITQADLEKVGTETVHYAGAANRTPQDSVSHVTFKREVIVDQVTGEKQGDNWKPESQNFMLIATPAVPGYVTEQTICGGEDVSASDCDREYHVQYQINQEPSTKEQKVQINYVDLSNQNKLITSETVTGQPNAVVEYDPQETIAALEKEGYELVNNGYNPNGEIEFFSNKDGYVPVFIITMKLPIIRVDADHPNELVDPSAYSRQIKFVVKYNGAGELTPKDNIQTIEFKRSVTASPITGKIIEDGKYTTPWQSDQEVFEDVVVPVVPGYHADKKVINGGKSVDSIENTVNYAPNGRIIPVGPDDKELEDVKQPIYKTNATDATQVESSILLPKVKGYNCDLVTVTPEDPGKDTRVTYKPIKKDDVLVIKVGKNKQPNTNDQKAPAKPVEKPAEELKEDQPAVSEPQPVEQPVVSESKKAVTPEKAEVEAQEAVINFIDLDQNGKQLTSSGVLRGMPGESINDLYSSDIPLKVIKKAGYKVVFNNFDIPGVTQRFSNNKVMIQIFTIGLSKKDTTEGNN